MTAATLILDALDTLPAHAVPAFRPGPILEAEGPTLRDEVPERAVLSWREVFEGLEDFAFAGDPAFLRLASTARSWRGPLDAAARERLDQRLTELEKAYWPRAARRGLARAWETVSDPLGVHQSALARSLAELREAGRRALAVGLVHLVDPEELAVLEHLGAALRHLHRLADVDALEDERTRGRAAEALERPASAVRTFGRSADYLAAYVRGGGLRGWLAISYPESAVARPDLAIAFDLQRQLWRFEALLDAQTHLQRSCRRTVPGVVVALGGATEWIRQQLERLGPRFVAAEAFRAEAARLVGRAHPLGLVGHGSAPQSGGGITGTR